MNSVYIPAVTTPMVQKLKLLPILECLYYDLQTANVVSIREGYVLILIFVLFSPKA